MTFLFTSTIYIFIIFNFLLLININNAYYPIYNYDENKNEGINTILTRPQYLYRHFAPMARGAFVTSPLLDYRFLSLNSPDDDIILKKSNQINNENEVDQNNKEILKTISSSKLKQFNSSPSSYKYDQLFFGPPTKKNFYTHIWRDIVQKMPSYRENYDGGRRLFQSRDEQQQLLSKRNPTDRILAMRVG